VSRLQVASSRSRPRCIRTPFRRPWTLVMVLETRIERSGFTLIVAAL
jgi:hypothetical protein